MDSRAVSSVVGKLLVSGLTVLYITSIAGLFVGGLVPDYRAATSDELGERVLATAAGHVEQAQTETDGVADVRAETTLPATIRDQQYRIRLVNGTLLLDHPDEGLDARTRLSLPAAVTATNSTWHSDDPLVVRVTGPPSNRTVTLAEADR
ncbi:DUF7266 family protein [Salinibaculum rarum]|uniref:DUF7266 family protein n=1 Tax=Salinibaculum rarum TaxID=3058903 RepID=UPI00265F29EC|nr:hypothetical protein [Salinibaculum sp. KK48]